ncbi:MAG: hemerythrin domain-containing protein [Polyangiaceae bacterium]|nr:hemerythrin domain-containing protein [Polyangiaceae bacterium]
MLTRLGRSARSSTTLVGLLVDCHGRIRQFLGVARAVAEREDVGAADRAEACQRVERYFRVALPLHVRDEEDGLAPRLTTAPPAVLEALATMTRQHAEHTPLLEGLLAALAAVEAAPDDLARRAALAGVVRELEPELEAHLRLEEAVVFPYLERALSREVEAELVAELRARRAPVAAPEPPRAD